jgi:hypothetical protein
MVHRSGEARNAILDTEAIVEIQSYDLLVLANVLTEYNGLQFLYNAEDREKCTLA